MKDLIKKIIHEVVGVPKGIELSAKNMYNDVVRFLEQNPEYVENEEEFELDYGQKYGFSDYDIEKVTVTIEHFEAKNFNNYSVVGMGVRNEGQRDGRILNVVYPKNVVLKIKIARPKNSEIEIDKVMSLLKSNKSARYISSFAHELKHLYDQFKNPKANEIGKLAIYKTFSETNFGNKVVDRFIYNTYFSSRLESLVRPSELYTLATEKGITKKDFMNFLKQTRIYQILQRITNTSYEDFRGELKKNMKFVNSVIQNFEDVTIPEDDDGKIDLFLKGLYVTLSNRNIDNFKESLALNQFFASLSIFNDDDNKLYNNFRKKVIAYENREIEYFKDMFKENQNQSYQAIKKLGKIYSILPDGPETEKMDEVYQKMEIFDPTNFEMFKLVNKISKIIISK